MLLTLPLAALLIGCGSAHKDTTATKAATVPIKSFKFGPALHVAAGTTVTWVNDDNAPHTVTGRGISLTLKHGQRGSFTFSKPGTYAYVCQFHPFMHGTVVVG